jgi:hypothetical protein
VAGSATPDPCLFCCADLAVAGRAREHVLPRWLLRHYDIEKTMVEPAWTNARDGSLRDKRVHPLKAMVLGHVCAGCNNGWMSELEVTARPTLLELSGGRLAVSELAPLHRVVLARWALKTAVVLNRSSNFHQLATAEQAAATRTDRLPDGVIVIAHVLSQRDQRDVFWWLQHQGIAQMLNARDSDDLVALQQGAWRCFIGFERLGLLVAYVRPSPEWRWFLDPRYETPIWPMEGVWMQRRSSTPPADDMRLFSLWMSMSVGLCRADDSRGLEAATVESWRQRAD